MSDLGVELWLCPKSNTAIHDKLTVLMRSLSTLFPGQPPKIEPHITITGDISMDLEDSEKSKEEVYRVLWASVVAVNSLPKNHSNLITLGNLNSLRRYLKKLYFNVEKDPNLISFATIIRELFVELPKVTSGSNSGGASTTSTTASADTTGPPQDSSSADPKRVAQEAAQQWGNDEYEPYLGLVYSDIYPIDSALWRTVRTRVQDYLNINDVEDISDHNLGWQNGVLKLVLCEGEVHEWVVLGSVDLH